MKSETDAGVRWTSLDLENEEHIELLKETASVPGIEKKLMK